MGDPADDTELHRFVWSPDDIDENGALAPSAFRMADFNGGDAHVSVDRMDLAKRDYVLPTLIRQQAKADPEKQIYREVAYSALLSTLDVRQAVDSDGQSPFAVLEMRLDDNPAHCGILNVTGKKGGYRNQLRIMLIGLVNQLTPFDELFPEDA